MSGQLIGQALFPSEGEKEMKYIEDKEETAASFLTVRPVCFVQLCTKNKKIFLHYLCRPANFMQPAIRI